MKSIITTVFGLALLFHPIVGKNINVETTKQEFEKKTRKKTIQEVSDSICLTIGVPPQLIREVGNNESGWRCIKNINGGSDYGDLQVIEPTFNYWYKELGLEGGKTRKNYLIVGIHYFKTQYDRYGSWEKARFSYARGSWRPEHTWTCLEEKFMGKIDWRQYDGN